MSTNQEKQDETLGKDGQLPSTVPRTGIAGYSTAISLMLPPELLTLLTAEAKFKDRSEQTHMQVHVPVLQTKLPIDLLLLGDSMFERFNTTGQDTVMGVNNTSYPGVFNAGVGGDKIRNVVYRSVREEGLSEHLKSCGGAECIFLEIGTNDLGDGKQALKARDIEVYRLMVEALRIVCAPRLNALVICGLNTKKKVKRQEVVKESNISLKELVMEFQRDLGRGSLKIEYLDAPENIINHLEEDGVHLNEEGYRIFAQRLWDKYQELRGLSAKLEATNTLCAEEARG